LQQSFVDAATIISNGNAETRGDVLKLDLNILRIGMPEGVD